MILPWDKLVTLALAGYGDIVERLFRDVERMPFHSDPSRAFAEELTGDFDNLFADVLADMGYASYLNGAAEPLLNLEMQNVPIMEDWRGQYYKELERIPRTWLWDGISFPSGSTAWRPVAEKAVKAIKSWDVMKRKDFDRLSRVERSMAWTITGINTKKALKKIRASLASVPMTGQSRVQWYRTVKDEFDKANLGPSSAELVFRVASTKGYHEGMERIVSNPNIGNLLPYVKVFTINDSRRTLACSMMAHSGLNSTAIYRRDDPAYIHNRTPRHFNCRCKDSFLTVRQAAREGVQEAIRWLETGIAPTKPEHVLYFEVPMPKGWIPISLKMAA